MDGCRVATITENENIRRQKALKSQLLIDFEVNSFNQSNEGRIFFKNETQYSKIPKDSGLVLRKYNN